MRALVTGGDAEAARARLAELRETIAGASALDEIEAGFGLSAFERQTLLLACGPELVGDVARELLEHTGAAPAQLRHRPRRPCPTPTGTP